MVDEVDLAMTEMENSIRIATQKFYRDAEQKTDRSGAVVCKECDEDIPPERAAIFGVTRCLYCQEAFEIEQVKRR